MLWNNLSYKEKKHDHFLNLKAKVVFAVFYNAL